MTAEQPPALLLGGAVNALSAARTLGRMGVAVHAVGESAQAPVQWSRFVRGFHHFGSSEEWLPWMESVRLGAVVIPCGDSALELVARERARLVECGYLPVEADDSLVLAMLDKERGYELAAAAGVDVPRRVAVSSAESAESAVEAARAIGFPCALKPRSSHKFSERFEGKALVVADEASLLAEWRALEGSGLEMIVTEIVSATHDDYCSYYSYFDEHGEPLLHFTKRKLRQYPIGFGTGTFHETTNEADVAETGLRLFRHVGLRGIGNVEFKRDRRDGRLVMIECNLRLTAANELMRRAGVDMARVAYARAAGLPVLVLGGDYRVGLNQWHPIEDVRAFRDYRRAGQSRLGPWLRSVVRRQVLPVFTADDLGPSVRNGRVFARKVWRRVRR